MLLEATSGAGPTGRPSERVLGSCADWILLGPFALTELLGSCLDRSPRVASRSGSGVGGVGFLVRTPRETPCPCCFFSDTDLYVVVTMDTLRPFWLRERADESGPPGGVPGAAAGRRHEDREAWVTNRRNRNPRLQLEPQITSLDNCKINQTMSETPVY